MLSPLPKGERSQKEPRKAEPPHREPQRRNRAELNEQHGRRQTELRRVKQAVVGRGGADKAQVAYMMRALLRLTETPPPDAADALAIGLAHLYASDPTRAIKPASNDL